MNRKELLGKISTCLARFTVEVKQLNAASQYDINVHAENVLIPLLREVFEFGGLQNANVQTKNAPAIDLIDYESRVAVQVTSTADADKITHTLTKFTENEQHKPFDRLLIYIITERQASYRKDFKALLPEDYDFEPDRDIIDNEGLYKYINERILGIAKLEKISRLLSDEFTETKIDERQLITQYGQRVDEKPDRVYPNLLSVTFPQRVYVADSQFEFDYYKKALQANLKRHKQFWKLKHLTGKDYIKFYFQESRIQYSDAYVLFENKLLTFRNLHDSSERLRNVIDLGTITPLSPDEFINGNADRENVFKSLLKATLTEDLEQRGIEWIQKEKVYRFRMTESPPRPLKIKGKNASGRSVVIGVKSAGNESVVTDEDGSERVKKGKHYVCFRHVAFASVFSEFGGKWYMTVQPDWSFTSPSDGYKPSPYADKYATGLKQREHNDSIIDSFQFLADYLITASKGDLLTSGFTIQFSAFPRYFETKPAIPDEVWLQSEPKEKKDKSQYIIDYGT